MKKNKEPLKAAAPLTDLQKRLVEPMMCAAVHPSGARCGRENNHEGPHRPRNEHHCHARGCLVPTKPEMLMCGRHWSMVPMALRRAVWMTYRQGQCDDMEPSVEWHAAADAAIAAVAAKEASKASARQRPQTQPQGSKG